MLSPDKGFPKSARLLSRSDFSRVFGDATAVSDASFTILCRPNALGYPRLGLAISKKALRRSVDRNLVKRIVRESFRQRSEALQGRDLVVLARRGIDPKRRQLLHDSLQRLWERSRQRCSPPPCREAANTPPAGV